MPKSAHLSESITVAEAAEILGVDRKTIIRRVGSGALTPIQKLPGRTGAYLFDRAEVDRLATERAS